MNGVSLKAEVSPLVCMESGQDAGYFWFQDHLPKLLRALLAWNQSPQWSQSVPVLQGPHHTSNDLKKAELITVE